MFVGQHPGGLPSPDGRFCYIAAAGDNSVTVVDVKTIKVVAHIPVGQVPKRNGTTTMLVAPVGKNAEANSSAATKRRALRPPGRLESFQ